MIEKDGVQYEKDAKGAPILPVFKLAASEVAHPTTEAPVFAKRPGLESRKSKRTRVGVTNDPLKRWRNGVVESWSNVAEGFLTNTPILHHSITPLPGYRHQGSYRGSKRGSYRGSILESNRGSTKRL